MLAASLLLLALLPPADLQGTVRAAATGAALMALVVGAGLAVALLDDRLDLVVHESANGVAHQTLLFGEERVQLQQIDAWKAAQGGCPPMLFGSRARG